MQPPAPGQKRVKEDWENIYYVGMFGTMGLAAVLLYFKPDTRCVLVAAWTSKRNKSNAKPRSSASKHGLQKKLRSAWRKRAPSPPTLRRKAADRFHPFGFGLSCHYSRSQRHSSRALMYAVALVRADTPTVVCS